MKQDLKNETDMLELMNKIHAQLILLDRKVDTLMSRSWPEARPSQKAPVHSPRLAVNSNEHDQGRVLHKAICADCQKQCTIPFKPSGDRPVYCQECFSRRKVIKLSGVTFGDKFQDAASAQTAVHKDIDIQKPQVKSKRKAVTVKKPIGKKKPVPKKK